MQKKKLLFLLILILGLIVLILLSHTIYSIVSNNTNFEKNILNIAEKNDETIFSINNITYFSSASADTSIQSNSNFTINNLYQYTDIAIFLNNNTDSETPELKNTLKELYIDNIQFVKSPQAGTPSLYYKSINKFATASNLEENKIEDSIHFDISSEDNADLTEPVLYNNCANPIVLSFVNDAIKQDYTITDVTNTYDGSLLKKCSIPLSSIETEISFNIHITNNEDQEFICPIYLKFPLETSNSSIYDGKVILKENTNYTFYRLN